MGQVKGTEHFYDIHDPVRPVRIKCSPSPWLTPFIINRAKPPFKKFATTETLTKYKTLRSLCYRICRDAKHHYIHNSVQNLTQQVQRFLRSLGVDKPSEACKSSEDLNILNFHFTTPPLTLDTHVKTSTPSILNSQAPSDLPQFFFKSVNAEMVKKCVRSISTKAIGSDKVSLEMILPMLENITSLSSHCHIVMFFHRTGRRQLSYHYLKLQIPHVLLNIVLYISFPFYQKSWNLQFTNNSILTLFPTLYYAPINLVSIPPTALLERY